ncbi:ABC transporter ATP-binding protein [Actinospica sp.]|jgi:putative ABC transport system ATP-binding protein|uniref:ABC transporter ATP-binding protein n=1 Tax=Actinospica sp. TaxID=1872142 RepID=UPI002BCEED61|nr:ABC transporter ATP-binding protein [Actinospica sp.]HWG26985.1 ABC transporter ATP-binding protein [Actinospica sp.]
MSDATIVRAEGLRRSYGSGTATVEALRGVSFTIGAGELVVLRGRSGSGKTTLLNLLGGLDRPSGGAITVAGRRLDEISQAKLLELRREKVSFIFQSFGLIPILSAAENVGVPLRLLGVPAARREDRARTLLRLVGLGDHMQQRAHELSGGQQQRVAIARALAAQPTLLLADEPTGQLDSQTGAQIMRLLRTLVHSEGVTALIATHDKALVQIADRVLTISDGLLTEGLGD